MSNDAPYFLLRLDDPAATRRYLIERGWLADETVVSIERAGEGNMNLVLRVTMPDRSIIVKQARPWVEKYPSIPAPDDRALVELSFYDALVEIEPLASRMPSLLCADPPRRVLLFEDLGDVQDFTSLYADPTEAETVLPGLVEWLSTLHRTPFAPAIHESLRNRAMRELNHVHLYDLPLRPNNGLDLESITPGLQPEADRLKADTAYVAIVRSLGDQYLADGDAVLNGDVLLHGDFYPGSWVRARDGARVIDPEFCFFGPAEYDVGVLAAHLLMARLDEATLGRILKRYVPPEGFETGLAARYAGMEIMRRLLGVGQLPMLRSIGEKRALLERSRMLVLGEAELPM